MGNSPQHEIICEFFQVFISSMSKILEKDLDEDICTKIGLEIISTSKMRDAESLKENNAIYRLDYATGNRQGTLAILIPEELIASVSDILTGGTGQDCYKGSLSEIETNSCLKLLEKIFKNIEIDFKKRYEHNLAFSADASLLLKESLEYSVNSEYSALDFVISGTFSLSESHKHNISILTNISVFEKLMEDLGLSQSASSDKKRYISSLNVDLLSDININITAELGRTRVPIKYALELIRGSLVGLNTKNNEDIKVFANGVEFAHAQVVAVEDNFGLKITKIIPPEERMGSVC